MSGRRAELARRASLPAALLAALLVVLPAAGHGAAPGEDIRAAWRRAAAEREAARREAAAVRREIESDRARLQAALAALGDSLAVLDAETAALRRRRDRLSAEATRRQAAVDRDVRDLKVLTGNARQAARDARSLLEGSPLTAFDPGRLARLDSLLAPGAFPGVDDVAALGRILLDEIRRSGRVALRPGAWIDAQGERREGTVLQVGALGAARAGDRPDLLRYLPEDHALHAPLRPSPRAVRRGLARYLRGESEGVPVDLSGGAVLGEMGARSGWREQLRAGGPLVWPILLIGLLAAGIVVERLLTLRRVHGNTEGLMSEVNALADAGRWDECVALVERHRGKGWPVVRVLRAGLAARDQDRETLESVLQEAILRELPRLERALPLLAIFGAVAPLLGLLGTVSGMIDTFRIITLYGTGDPRLMAGGISEALITTELGLAVAIPVLLLHSWLSRRVEHVVGDMEEKAVALTNIIGRRRS